MRCVSKDESPDTSDILMRFRAIEQMRACDPAA
jgi:hypothetical protein